MEYTNKSSNSIRLVLNYLHDYINTNKIKKIDKSHEIRKIKPCDILISFATVDRYFKFNEEWFGPIPDTFRYYMEKLGYNVFSIEYNNSGFFRIPRYSKSYIYQHIINNSKIKAKINTILMRNKLKVNLPQFSQFVEYLKSNRIDNSLISEKTLIYKYYYIRILANQFKKLLIKSKVKICFEITYYNIESFALTLACKELNIPTVDIQHGLQGKMHLAYSSWNIIPNSGYQLLPQYFWVWTQEDSNVINEWAFKSNENHLLYTGGNLWIDFWKQKGNPLLETYQNLFNIELKDKKIELKILISLNPGCDRNDIIFKILEKSPQSWFWWIRLHPSMKDKEKIREIINSTQLKNYSLDQATDLPLPIILKNVDLHITNFSSVIIEAEQFGVPTIFTHPDSELIFPDQIKRGIATGSYSVESLMNDLNKFIISKSQYTPKKKGEMVSDPINKIQNFLQIAIKK
jgi:hypothetical protein